MVTLRTSTSGIYKKVHTFKVVASPAPTNTADITYIVGPVSEFSMGLVAAGINLNNDDILKIDAKLVFSTGTPSGGHGIQFNSDSGNNYGTTTQIRTASGNSPNSNITIYNSTQSGDTVDFHLYLRTEFNNNPGAGILSGYKVLSGSGWSRNANSYGSLQYDTVNGIWRNSANNLTSIRFFRTSGSSTINIDVGTEIRFFQEQK